MSNDINWATKKLRRDLLKSHVWRFLLFPTFWNDKSKQITTQLTWKKVKFTDANASLIPTTRGIYCFVLVPPTANLFITRYLFYIGKASSTTLRARYINYLDERDGKGIGKQKPRIKVQEMLNVYEGHLYFFYSSIGNQSDIIDCEEKLLNTFFPYVNTLIPEATISEEYKHIY